MFQTGETKPFKAAQQIDLDFGLNMRLSDTKSGLRYTPMPKRAKPKTAEDRIYDMREELAKWYAWKEYLESQFELGQPTEKQLDEMADVLENITYYRTGIEFLENGFKPSAYDYRETDEWKKLSLDEKQQMLGGIHGQ